MFFINLIMSHVNNICQKLLPTSNKRVRFSSVLYVSHIVHYESIMER